MRLHPPLLVMIEMVTAMMMRMKRRRMRATRHVDGRGTYIYIYAVSHIISYVLLPMYHTSNIIDYFTLFYFVFPLQKPGIHDAPIHRVY
jgi:hypothetical protein